MTFQYQELDRVKIKIFGIGEEGHNVVTHMKSSSLKDVDFFSIDANQATNQKIEGTHLLFLIANAGEPKSIETCLSIAKHSRKLNILTVAIITAKDSVDKLTELEQCADSLIAISDKNSVKINESALDIVQGISDLITQQGLIGFDFADAKTVLTNVGRSLSGAGAAAGVNRAKDAAEKALSCFNGFDVGSAGGILVNISAAGVGIEEFDEIGNIVHNLASENSTIKIGITKGEGLGNVIKVTIIATMLDVSITNKI